MGSTHTTTPIDEYLRELWERKGTDLLLTSGAPPLMRIDGEMSSFEGAEPLTTQQVNEIVVGILGDTLAMRLEIEKEIDFSFNWEGMARFRGNAFHQRRSLALALRLIPFEIPTFDELGLPRVIDEFVNLPQGLILVTGPTGSGKSTTLASMIDYINEHRACHILTIEDPIEYVHHHRNSAINQREIGEDSRSFERALRSALREDPDVLLVGEMRDPESISTTLTIAETGHLVFATLHTNDTAQAIDRIVDVFPADKRIQIEVQLASVLQGVVYQRLLPRVGGGMIAAYEVLVTNNAVKNLLREGKTRQLRNIVATGQAEGMCTLEMSLSDLVGQGFIEYQTAVNASMYPHEVAHPTAFASTASHSVTNGKRHRRKG